MPSRRPVKLAAGLLALAAVAALGWTRLAAAQPPVEVTRSVNTVTVREEMPPEVAVDPAARVYHVAGCPSITPAMRWMRPGAAVLNGCRLATDCAPQGATDVPDDNL